MRCSPKLVRIRDLEFGEEGERSPVRDVGAVRRWLLDTNVISELRKARCHAAVKTWSEAQAPELLYLSRITIAEIRFGIEQHRDGESFREKLANLARRGAAPWFGERILEVDEEVILEWRRMVQRGKAVGHTFSQPDLFIAATAAVAGLSWSPGTSQTSRSPACRSSIRGPVNSGPDALSRVTQRNPPRRRTARPTPPVWRKTTFWSLREKALAAEVDQAGHGLAGVDRVEQQALGLGGEPDRLERAGGRDAVARRRHSRRWPAPAPRAMPALRPSARRSPLAVRWTASSAAPWAGARRCRARRCRCCALEPADQARLGPGAAGADDHAVDRADPARWPAAGARAPALT